MCKILAPRTRLAVIALCLGVATVPSAAVAQPRSSVTLANPYAAHVTEAAQRFGIPESWIWSVMRTESAGNPAARSSKGAMGLMQIMPATWTTLTTRFQLGGNPFDVHANIHAGAAYLRQMWDRYGNVTAMLAAYNAGPARADAYVVGRGNLPGETSAYVARIAPAITGTTGLRVAYQEIPRPVTWQHSTLFIGAPVPDRAPSERPAAPPANVSSAPQSKPRNGLFIPLSSQVQQ